MATHDPLRDLGVRVDEGGGELRMWSAHATAVEVCLFDHADADRIVATAPLSRDEHDVWSVRHPLLVPGTRYSLRVRGEGERFDDRRNLLDPYARGLVRSPSGEWRSYVQDDAFDWCGVNKPRVPLDHTVIYEAHAKGISKLNPALPEEFRGTYAGLAHETAIAQLKDLGVTTIQLLPVHQSVSEERLTKLGFSNYWGYNTLNFFTPHTEYASAAARAGGTAAVLREFKGMVKLLHEAGLEVVLDVVYNHTSEQGPGGPTTSFRGIDDASYYRQDADGNYVDVTGCGNSLNTSVPAVQRLVLDSLRYWANEVQVDGFRFDLAATLGRNAAHEFDPEHPLLQAIIEDPQLQGVKMIAEPWDVGVGGWQTGNFPAGWMEWNDGYRDRMRDFWLSDIAAERHHGTASQGIGSMTRRFAGSAHVFNQERGPLASVNFITAHDGFTMADLTSYNRKHNLGNGEFNRDGTDNNHSFNHGWEGPSDDPEITTCRRKAMRNLLGTLLLSAGIPMITAGDEFGRSQRGNNNAYCHDDELSWLPWEHEEWQRDLFEISKKLLRLRRENPALRPVRFGKLGEKVPSASEMHWYNAAGSEMSIEDWDSPSQRVSQYLAASTPEHEGFNRILLVVQGRESEEFVCLPEHPGVSDYMLLWDSALDITGPDVHAPGSKVRMAPTSMQLFLAR
ncbi:glycogen debranching protein GlgX [Salinibacterium sp. dk2585]|uniref:glycogen debranching protein GlgX n=1 Tax=unclassified Salinibacterium TaxID=2632331 RepID=UPI0011C2440D|nr:MULTISPECIES: glycogen debranching protein GlgX [unclassified Salinibacterium]QEE61569.1 glycogen debranching protein GlgX [Salinibacterium sp. dk2585]TXK52462.1 glycogen debranching protein GlgX [Salinibacterium sp. dk5596]